MVNYEQQIRSLEQAYFTDVGKRDQLQKTLDSTAKRRAEIKAQTILYEETRILLQKAGTQARESARLRLEETVTDALKYIFGDDFAFHIEMRESGGRTEAEFYVSSDYNGTTIKTKPQDARGGGIVDIVSIALRVALVQIYTNPKIQGPIILDEPGKHVSADYTMKLATFLQQVSKTFGRQIILSTHQPDLASIADNVYHVDIKDGATHVTKSN